MWAVPESLEIGLWGWDFLGSSPQALSARVGCEEKASFSLNIHRSPIPIFNSLPSKGASLVCEWSPRYLAATPSMSHCHLGRAPSEQLGVFLVYIWCLVWLWLPIQSKLVIESLYNSLRKLTSIDIEVLLPGGMQRTSRIYLLKKMACYKLSHCPQARDRRP